MPTRRPAQAARPRPRRARYHHGDLRQALRDAALELVRSQGPEGFTLREAALKAGVASGAPYRHFSSRRALLAAVAEEGDTRLHAAMLRAAPGTLPPLDRLREVALACWSLAHGLASLALDGQLSGTSPGRRSEAALAQALVRLKYRGLAPASEGGR